MVSWDSQAKEGIVNNRKYKKDVEKIRRWDDGKIWNLNLSMSQLLNFF
jgi:hypothetical protein